MQVPFHVDMGSGQVDEYLSAEGYTGVQLSHWALGLMVTWPVYFTCFAPAPRLAWF